MSNILNEDRLVAFCIERLAAALKVSFSAHIIRLLQLDSSRLKMLM